MTARLDDGCLVLVNAAIARHGSIKALALMIGYARSSLSLAMRGQYEGRLDAMSAAIRETFTDRVACPHLAAEIAAGDCKSHRTRLIPTAEPMALRHWAVCQTCSFNPSRRST